jgi:hypothetical protein
MKPLILDQKYLIKPCSIKHKLYYLYGHNFKSSKEKIEEQVFTSNFNNHYDLVVVTNILELLPINYLSVVVKDIFSYSSKHVMVILNFKSDMFKPVVKQLSKYPRHSFYFNQ